MSENEDLNVTVHLDVLPEGSAYLQMVSVGMPGESESIILKVEAAETEGDLIVTASFGGLFGTVEGIDALALVADAFHQAVAQGRHALVEGLIQPTRPTVSEDANEDDTAHQEPTA